MFEVHAFHAQQHLMISTDPDADFSGYFLIVHFSDLYLNQFQNLTH